MRKKTRKRLVIIVSGIIEVLVSLVWMNHVEFPVGILAAAIFAIGLITVFSVIKKMLIDISRTRQGN